MSDRNRDDNAQRSDEYIGERLQRVLSQRGVASRRAGEQMIVDGRIQVNGRVVTELGTRVNPYRDEIRVDGKVLRPQPPRYIMLNKPSGFITTVSDERDRWTVMDLVDVRERVYPVGRLDRSTQGLILLTNDGDLAHRVMHPRYRIDKEYLVFTDRRPTESQLQHLRDGITIDGRTVVPDEVRLFRETNEGIAIRIVIHEGLYHVVRRMMEAVGIGVTRLRRTRLGPLRIQGIPTGAWRDLTAGELVQLYQAVGLPEEDAKAANNRRTIMSAPVGGYTHKGVVETKQSGRPDAPSSVDQARRKAAPARNNRERPRGDERRSRGSNSGNANVRSSQGHRDRRSRGGR
ncbi:MAG TPA: pseudouridine synthase [Thermomicrobiales bacterium]|nr:pseudouridine synthase [Thermomicrobiales bacterium]